MPEMWFSEGSDNVCCFFVHIGWFTNLCANTWFTNLCVNTAFASVPIIHIYTETAEEMIVNMQMGGGGGVEIVV